MRSQILISLFSIVALASITGYLVMSSHKQQLVLKQLSSAEADCLQYEIIQIGHAYPTWDYHISNVCEQPKKFIFKYKYISTQTTPAESFESNCLASGVQQYTPFSYPFTSIEEAIQIDCQL